MTTAEINARFAELESACNEDDRHDIAEQYRQWIYRTEERAAELQRRLDAIVVALDPGPQPSFPDGTDYARSLHEWYDAANIHSRIKAIAEGKP